MSISTDQQFSPISVPSITDLVYQTLRGEISNGLLRPGPLHLRRLAERFCISAVPVREALRRLEAEGLVTFGPNRRIVINGLSEVESDEVFVIRSELEQLAVRSATPHLRGRPDLLREPHALIAKMDEMEDDAEGWRTANQEFHWFLYTAADMPRLNGIINSLWVAHEPYLRLYLKTVDRLRAAQDQDQHRLMLAQVVAGDADGAAATLAEHLEATRRVVRERIREEAVLGNEPGAVLADGADRRVRRTI